MAPSTVPSNPAVTQGDTHGDVNAGTALIALAFSHETQPSPYNPNAWSQGGPNTAQDLFDAQFPSGIKPIPTQATGRQCGLHAIRNSIRAADIGTVPPTIAELEQVAQEPELDITSKNNYYERELAKVLHCWGRLRGQNLHLGFLQFDGPPMLSGLEGDSDNDAQVFWIYNDNAAPEDSANSFEILNHWSGVQSKEAAQANAPLGELGLGSFPNDQTSAQSTSIYATFTLPSSSRSAQPVKGVALAEVSFTHSGNIEYSPQPVLSQSAASLRAFPTQAPSPPTQSQHSSHRVTPSLPPRFQKLDSPNAQAAPIAPGGVTGIRRSSRVAQATAKAKQQAVVTKKLRQAYEFRYLCPVDGCKGSANSLQDLNRYHRRKDHAILGEFEEAQAVNWLDWLGGRTSADVPVGIKTRYKRLLKGLSKDDSGSLRSPAVTTKLAAGSKRKPSPRPQDSRSKKRADGRGQQPTQQLHDGGEAYTTSHKPQQGIDDERESLTSGGSSASQKRKRTDGRDDDSPPSPEKKPKLKLIVGARSELRRRELELVPAAPTTATIQPPIPLPHVPQGPAAQNAVHVTAAGPRIPGSDASDTESSENGRQGRSPGGNVPPAADADGWESHDSARIGQSENNASAQARSGRGLQDAIPLALLHQEQEALQQKLDARKAELEAAGGNPAPDLKKRELLAAQNKFVEQQKRDFDPVSQLDLTEGELKAMYSDFADPLAELQKVPTGFGAATDTADDMLGLTRTDKELRSDLRSLFPPEKRQPGFLARAKDAVKAGHILSTKEIKMQYRRRGIQSKQQLDWADEDLDNQLLLAAVTYIVNLQETLGKLIQEHEKELTAATHEQIARLLSLPDGEALKAKMEEFSRILEAKNVEIAHLKKQASLRKITAKAEREEIEETRDEINDNRLQFDEDRQNFEEEKAAFE